MTDDVLINKAATIERCILRVRQEYAGEPNHLLHDQTKQDAIILNIQRATEAAIDLAMHIVAQRKLGIPQESRDAFDFLSRAGLVGAELAQHLKRMVGFRNVAVHDYQKLNLAIVQRIVEHDIDDLANFAKTMVLLP